MAQDNRTTRIIAEFMGWICTQVIKAARKTTYAWKAPAGVREGAPPQYTTDQEAMKGVEFKLYNQGLWNEYRRTVLDLIGEPPAGITGVKWIQNASAAQRAEAARRVIEANRG